jgi:hypothetical protein
MVQTSTKSKNFLRVKKSMLIKHLISTTVSAINEIHSSVLERENWRVAKGLFVDIGIGPIFLSRKKAN